MCVASCLFAGQAGAFGTNRARSIGSANFAVHHVFAAAEKKKMMMRVLRENIYLTFRTKQSRFGSQHP
jgi:hypothetical protein